MKKKPQKQTNPLTERQQRFVDEYCVDFNGCQAAIRAGYSKQTARKLASQLLLKKQIKDAVESRKKVISEEVKVDAMWVLKQWIDIASADPNEITQLRRTCCRHCHGVDHRYQWTQAEYDGELEEALNKQKEAPDGSGGFGFNLTLPPHKDCPECGGLGKEEVYIADTRTLEGPAKRLYGGVQKTKEGLKVLMRDQDAALMNIAKYLGMMIDKKEVSGPNGGPMALSTITASELTDDQLAALIKSSD